jgi:hypothetical protein
MSDAASGDDAALEWKLRAGALPVALALAVAFHATATGHFLQRTFLSMMVHEVGHAVTAWWCGYGAIPTLWKTMIPDERSRMVSLAVAVAIGWLFVRAWRAQRAWLAAVALALGVAQLVATMELSDGRAHAWIIFGGDGGAMVLGTLLMLTFFVGPSSALRTQHLRWGFLVIGAAALIDTFATWWAARSNVDAIPFGEIEGVGLSDPSQLEELHGWTTSQLVHRYAALGVACFAVLAVVWLRATWLARRAAASPG